MLQSSIPGVLEVTYGSIPTETEVLVDPSKAQQRKYVTTLRILAIFAIYFVAGLAAAIALESAINKGDAAKAILGNNGEVGTTTQGTANNTKGGEDDDTSHVDTSKAKIAVGAFVVLCTVCILLCLGYPFCKKNMYWEGISTSYQAFLACGPINVLRMIGVAFWQIWWLLNPGTKDNLALVTFLPPDISMISLTCPALFATVVSIYFATVVLPERFCSHKDEQSDVLFKYWCISWMVVSFIVGVSYCLLIQRTHIWRPVLWVLGTWVTTPTHGATISLLNHDVQKALEEVQGLAEQVADPALEDVQDLAQQVAHPGRRLKSNEYWDACKRVRDNLEGWQGPLLLLGYSAAWNAIGMWIAGSWSRMDYSLSKSIVFELLFVIFLGKEALLLVAITWLAASLNDEVDDLLTDVFSSRWTETEEGGDNADEGSNEMADIKSRLNTVEILLVGSPHDRFTLLDKEKRKCCCECCRCCKCCYDSCRPPFGRQPAELELRVLCIRWTSKFVYASIIGYVTSGIVRFALRSTPGDDG